MAVRVIAHNPTYQGLLEMKANIVFAQPDGKPLALQLVKPQWASGGVGFPLVVFIQGSAWTGPNPFWELPQLCQLAAKGYVVASVTHRSCWDVPAPAFLQDVKAAIRFLRAHAAEHDIDKARVCAWGTSSGGNAALLLGLTGDDPAFETDDWACESSAVQAVVDCFGPTDLLKMAEIQYADATGDIPKIFRALGGQEDCRGMLRRMSPISYVKPGRVLPPFLLLHGDADDTVLYEDTEALYHQLTAQGYQAELVHVTDAPHEGSFWSQELLGIIFDFVAEAL